MNDTRQLVDALKQVLRMRGLTYAALAQRIGLSEASVKRLFSTGHFTLDRFEQVCELARTSITELARELEGGQDEVEKLTLPQVVTSAPAPTVESAPTVNEQKLEQLTKVEALPAPSKPAPANAEQAAELSQADEKLSSLLGGKK